MNNNKTKRLNLYLDALNKRGLIFMHIGEPNSTLEDYRKIQEHTKDLNKLNKLMISIAKVYSQGLSDYKEAKSILKGVISQLQERGKEDIFADAISALGKLALTLFEKAKLYKNMVQKKKLFQESKIIFEKISWNLWVERAKKELKLLRNI